MIAGGLAGASPHMISATVTAMSRLVFEFRGTLGSFLVCVKRLMVSHRRHLVEHADGDLHYAPCIRHLRKP